MAGVFVRLVRPVPSGLIRYRSFSPSASGRENTILVPSGDHAAPRAKPSSTIGASPVPSAFITASAHPVPQPLNTIFVPSGDQSGSKPLSVSFVETFGALAWIVD